MTRLRHPSSTILLDLTFASLTANLYYLVAHDHLDPHIHAVSVGLGAAATLALIREALRQRRQRTRRDS